MNIILHELNKRKLFYDTEESVLESELLHDAHSYKEKIVLSDITEPYVLHIYFNNSNTYFLLLTRTDVAPELMCVFGTFQLEHSLKIIDSYKVKENSIQRSERFMKWTEQEHDRMRANPLPFESVPDVPCVRCNGTGIHENSRRGSSCYQCKGKGVQTPQDIEDCKRWKKNYYQNLAKQELDEITFMEEEYKRQMGE